MCMCIVHVQCTTPCTVPCALPHGSQVDVIEVVWPDGACAVLSASVTIDTLHTVAYPTGSGDSTAACSNVTSANGGTRLSPLEMQLCNAVCAQCAHLYLPDPHGPSHPRLLCTSAQFTSGAPRRMRL